MTNSPRRSTSSARTSRSRGRDEDLAVIEGDGERPEDTRHHPSHGTKGSDAVTPLPGGGISER